MNKEKIAAIASRRTIEQIGLLAVENISLSAEKEVLVSLNAELTKEIDALQKKIAELQCQHNHKIKE